MKDTQYYNQSPFDLIAIDETIDGDICITHYKRTNVERIPKGELERFLQKAHR